MAVTAKLFAKFPQNLGGGDASGDGPMDLLSDAIKLTLHTGTWTPNQTSNEVKADATNELATAGGYTAGGTTLTSKTYAAASLVTTFDAADVSYSSLSVTFRHAPIWDDSVGTPADPLICNIDTGGNQTLVAVDLNFIWNAGGIWTFTVS